MNLTDLSNPVTVLIAICVIRGIVMLLDEYQTYKKSMEIGQYRPPTIVVTPEPQPSVPRFQQGTIVEQAQRQQQIIDINTQKAHRVAQNIQAVKIQIDEIVYADIDATVDVEKKEQDPDKLYLIAGWNDQSRATLQTLLLQVLKDLSQEDSDRLHDRIWDDRNIGDYVEIYERVKKIDDDTKRRLR